MARRSAEPAVPVVEPGPGKGRATPSRRQQEAARRRPLVVSDRKAARRASRTRDAEQRERARIGLANGEERYLPLRDRGPQRRLARDVIDSTWTFGEFLIPIFVIFFVGTIATPTSLSGILFVVLYGYLAVTVVDGLIRAALIRRRLTAQYGRGNVQRGLNLYTVMRAAQFRSLRTPKPQVKRGQKIA